MLKQLVILLCITVATCSQTLSAQQKQNADSIVEALQQIPDKYISIIDRKIDKYSSRINKKTEKTLKKLSKWEEKIKGTLQKLSPETAAKLFGNNQLTFTSLLQKIQQGQSIALDYHKQYDRYRDNLTTNIKYLEKSKAFLDSGLAKKVQDAKFNIQQLNDEEDSTDAIQQFIKERKKELITSAFKYMGNSKYLTKMNKEVWYYTETLKNYKEIFSDEEKTERLAKEVLNKIPGFQKFVQKNSMLASLFAVPGDVASISSGIGLQRRESVQSLIQQRIVGASGGPQAITKGLQEAQSQLNVLKQKLINPSLGTGDGTLPDFKPNTQKTKTFLQRLEFGSNIQFAKNNNLVPTTMDLAVTMGYKLNDKSVAGIGAGYKMGLGSIDRIRFSTEGISLRSFIDWKLKKQFFISGGWEINYLTSLPSGVTVLKYSNGWQQSALTGLTKKINIKTKWFKETKFQLLYDFLARRHMPVSQPLLFRIGYNF